MAMLLSSIQTPRIVVLKLLRYRAVAVGQRCIVVGIFFLSSFLGGIGLDWLTFNW